MPRTASAAKKPQKPVKKLPRVMQSDNDIFGLDIGTRNVVGVIGHMTDGVFIVDDAVSIPHKRRAMMDGQIEDIAETARIVRMVKEQLEERNNMTLTKVAIAAAGRALITKRSTVENDIDGKDKITENMLKALELEAVSKAQSELDKENTNSNITFYCVGHTVINYSLDDYKIKSLLGHKGKKAAVELIAAFLPSLVVESLYSVMDISGLDVSSLTLEPIAAMNVIIPPEVRLINIALVDIGAGTTDIAISQNGSIVAYAMATTAGDEITEEIIQKYLVDFETAEEMKLTSPDEDVVFTDILGFEHSITYAEFFESLSSAVEQLADTIAENILATNGNSPAAVFLVGGGSLIPNLSSLVADKLKIPHNRVAIGGQTYQKNVSVGKIKANSPEYVTPIGIGITSTLQTGYDFSMVTLNGNKIRIFDTKALTAADLLMNAGFKTQQIIGKSGRSLTFTLNGEKQNLRGETSNPAQILVNGLPVPIDYTIKQGDVIEFTPATIGMNAAVTISDIAGEIFTRKVYIDGEEYHFGTTARANETIVTGDYSIQNYDSITIETIETLEELKMSLPFNCDNLMFSKGDRPIRDDYILCENDSITTKEKNRQNIDNSPNLARDVAFAFRDEKASRTVNVLSNMTLSESPMPEVIPPPTAAVTELPADAPASKPLAESIAAPEEEKPEPVGAITVYLNSKRTVLEPNYNNSPHEFLELMALADIDISNPPASGNMILTLNGKDASFMDKLADGDRIVIKWDE